MRKGEADWSLPHLVDTKISVGLDMIALPGDTSANSQLQELGNSNLTLSISQIYTTKSKVCGCTPANSCWCGHSYHLTVFIRSNGQGIYSYTPKGCSQW